MGSHGEGKAHVHATRIVFHRRINKAFDFRKGDDFIKFPFDFHALHAEIAVEVNIFPPCQLRVKARAHFQQRTHPAVDISVAPRRLGNAAEDLEQGALPSPIVANDTDDFTTLDLKRDVLERPERFASSVVPTPLPRKSLLARRNADTTTSVKVSRRVFIGLPIAADTVLFAEIFYTESNVTHRMYLHNVGKRFFHAAKIETTTYKQRKAIQAENAIMGPGAVCVPNKAQRNPSTTPTIGLRP